MTSCIPALIGWLILALANHSGGLAALLTGRLLIGCGMGVEGSLHSVYVAELASSKLKGPLITSGVIMITLGILFIYILGTFVHWEVIIKYEVIRHKNYSSTNQSRKLIIK